MGKDEKTAAAIEANETGENQSKKAAKKLAKEAAKAAKVNYRSLMNFSQLFLIKRKKKIFFFPIKQIQSKF